MEETINVTKHEPVDTKCVERRRERKGQCPPSTENNLNSKSLLIVCVSRAALSSKTTCPRRVTTGPPAPAPAVHFPGPLGPPSRYHAARPPRLLPTGVRLPVNGCKVARVLRGFEKASSAYFLSLEPSRKLFKRVDGRRNHNRSALE